MAKRAEAIRGNEINELTYMSGQLIGILEQEVKPAPVVRPEQPQERPSVPAPTRRTENKVGPRSYITFSFGGAGFSMEELNAYIERVNIISGGDTEPIDGGLNLDFSTKRMLSETFGVGLSTSFLMGVASGTFPAGLEHEIKVIGTTFAFRPLLRQKLGEHFALCFGGDLGVISLSCSERSNDMEAEGEGPLFGGVASGRLLIGNFFLQGNMGFRSAKGEIELEGGTPPPIELDFSGSYILMTAGIRL
jgi:hypothetical protein